jgi:hypothetical protein
MKLTVNQWITINQQKAWNYVVLCKFNKKKALVLCLISISSYSFVNYLEQGFLPATWDFFFLTMQMNVSSVSYIKVIRVSNHVYTKAM